MESNNELIANLKKEVKEELKGEFNETAVGYIHIFNKRLEEKLREQMKPSATQQAKLEALIDEIIAVENIVITKEALDEQLNMVGQANQMTKEQVLEKIDLEGFKRDLSRMQASRIIVNNAVEK